MKPLIIGQAPARGNNDKPPFSGQSGARLARMAGLGSSGDVLPSYFQLINLVNKWPGKTASGRGDKFPIAEAKLRAERIMQRLLTEPVRERIVLMMGTKVTHLMGFGDLPLLHGRYVMGVEFISFPHPSGASAFWNDPTNLLIAGWILRGALEHGSQ